MRSYKEYSAKFYRRKIMMKMIKDFLKIKIKEIEDKKQKRSYYDLKLYLDNGTLFMEEKKVCVVHWDKNIYILYDEENNHIKRFHKGNNMLLILENKILKNE